MSIWHECGDWDGLLIGPSDPEMSACGCEGVLRMAVESTQCDCHPETCCCPDATLWIDGSVAMRGTREQCEQMELRLMERSA